MPELSKADVMTCARNGFAASFLPAADKEKFQAMLTEYEAANQ
jgi:hypothetical protein